MTRLQILWIVGIFVVLSGIALFWGIAITMSESSTQPILEATNAPTLVGEPALDIVEIGTNAEIIDSETIPLFNCNNLNEYQLDIERTRTIEHKVTAEGQIEAGLHSIFVLSLAGRYGVEDGQTETRSYTVHLTAPPNSWNEYTINWRYLWREGQIIVYSPDNTQQVYPYRVRAGLEFMITDIATKSCP